MEDVRLNSFDILSEASIMEYVNESVGEGDMIDSILAIHESIDEIDDSEILYTPEMIPVIKIDESTVIVDYYDLVRLMESYKSMTGICTEERAVQLISEHYDIPENHINILIESEDQFNSTVNILLEQIKKEKDPIKKTNLRNRLNNINTKIKDLYNNTSINLVKKKNKHNK